MRRRDVLTLFGGIGAMAAGGAAVTPQGQETLSDLFDAVDDEPPVKDRFEDGLNDVTYWAEFEDVSVLGDSDAYETPDGRAFVENAYAAVEPGQADAVYLSAQQMTSGQGVGYELSLHTFDEDTGVEEAYNDALFGDAYDEFVSTVDWDAAVDGNDRRGILPFDPYN